VCQPVAGIDRNRQLLILTSLPELPPRPLDDDIKTGKKHVLPKMLPIREGQVSEAPKEGATGVAGEAVKELKELPKAPPKVAATMKDKAP
jgi:rod shape-determining protein MreC